MVAMEAPLLVETHRTQGLRISEIVRMIERALILPTAAARNVARPSETKLARGSRRPFTPSF